MMRDIVGTATALIDAQIALDLVALGWTTALSSNIGSSADWLLNNPPAIVWVPTRDRFDTTVTSYRPPSGATAQLPSKFTCWMGFEARLWAAYTNLPVAGQLVIQPASEDFSAVEMLRDVVISALRKKVLGYFNILGGEWTNLSGPKQGAEELTLGRAYAMQIEIARPVVDLTAAGLMQTLTSVPQTRQIVTPQGTTTDTP